MSDPRLPLGEEPEDLGEIEDIEEVGGDADEGDPEDTADVEAEGSEDGAEDEDQSQRVERQPSRRERQAAHWRSRAETVEREAADLRRRLEAIEARQTQPDPQALRRQQEDADRQWLERIAQLPYEEQQREWANRTEARVAQAMQGMEFRTADRLDKAEWLNSTLNDPRRARLSAEVERTLQAERARGRNADREIIYKYLLGDEVDRAGREGRGTVNRQRQAANGRVRRQTTRPASGRGDTGRSGGRSRVDADEALLRGITAADI